MPRKVYRHKRSKRAVNIRKTKFNNSLLSNQSVIVEETPTEKPSTSSDDIFDQLLNSGNRCNNVNPFNEHANNGNEEEMDFDDSSDDDFKLPDLLVEHCEPEDLNITGRRVVDINHILKELKTLSKHPKKCTMGEYKFSREVVNGLSSKFIYHCDNCDTDAVITSEPDEKKQEVNDAVVWGALSIGVGHHQIQELFGLMDVPVMGPKKFKLHEKRIGKVWETTLFNKMKENAEEEKKIAIEKNHFLNGVPFITVLGDGGWAKRSYGHGMNSSSGVGVIIGAETKKLLYIGVRNKFCFVCTKYKSNESQPPKHECFLNYNGPSTGMESDIIVEGFKRSEEDYGLIYKYYIGDGDSSVFPHIQERCRYGRFVKKIECANHVTRALSDQLHKLANNTSYPIESRKLLSSATEGDVVTRLERLVKGVRTSIKEYGVNKSPEDVKNLRYDIKNSVDHVFGNHVKCRGGFCNRKSEENTLNKINTHFLTEIRKLIGRVEAKAESLVFNQTTNRAEQYMALVAKFTGGKRTNLSFQGSYRLRCLGAGLSHTSGPSWHLSPMRRLMMKSPGKITKSYMLARERRRLKRRLNYVQNGAPKKKIRKGGSYDREYGPLVVEADVEEDVLEQKKNDILQQLASDDRVETERLTVGQHGNACWQEKRMNRLTASKFGVVAKRLPHTSCHNLVKEILYPRDLKSQAVLYGRVNEETAIKQYELLTLSTVDKCGLFIDADHAYLGASPDGLVGENGLVEVKCLPSVKDQTLEEAITSGKNKDFCLERINNTVQLKRKHNYHYQIQGQLHIANREWCDFIVYTSSAPLFIERIDRDDDFWQTKIYPKVTQFFLECMLPEIANSRIQRGLKCRDPPYIVEAKERKERNSKTNK